MKYLFLLPFIFLFACQTTSTPPQEAPEPAIESFSPPYQTRGTIEIIDSTILQYVAAEAPIEVLASGFTWSEGPLWIPTKNYLLFSDVPMNRIYRWQADKGIDVYLQPSGYTGEGKLNGEPGSNGLTLNPQSQLTLCQHGDRRVALLNADGDTPQARFQTLASTFEGKRFNSPNDLVYDANGMLYFTDPPYGLTQQENDPAKELDFQGVFSIDTSGQIVKEIDSLTRPNGIALSPDGQTLYVANSDPARAYWMAYELDDSGHVNAGKILLDVTPLVGDENPGLPDGLKIHPDGTLFATGPGGVWVISADGKHLGTIRTGSKTANCAWGDSKYLYMTAHQYLMRVEVMGLEE